MVAAREGSSEASPSASLSNDTNGNASGQQEVVNPQQQNNVTAATTATTTAARRRRKRRRKNTPLFKFNFQGPPLLDPRKQKIIASERTNNSQLGIVVAKQPLRLLTPGEAEQYRISCRFCLEDAYAEDDPNHCIINNGHHEVEEEEFSSDEEQEDTATATLPVPLNCSRTVGNTGVVFFSDLPPNTTRHDFIAPCDCTGSAEWVHVGCLRQWQRQELCATSRKRQKRALYCRVCTIQFLLPPPELPPLNLQLLKRGTLLISTNLELDPDHPYFRKVVLLLNDLTCTKTTVGDAMGVIINAPPPPPIFDDEDPIDDLILKQFSPHDSGGVPRRETLEQSLTWRYGGPTFSNPLMDTHYVVAHTTNKEDYEELHHVEQYGYASRGQVELASRRMYNSSTSQGGEAQPQSSQEEENGTLSSSSSLYMMSEPGDTNFPAQYPEADLPFVVRRLTAAAEDSEEENVPIPPPPPKVVLFGGYCQWGRGGQLHKEIIRGSWKICPGTTHDILREDYQALWKELYYGDRLISQNHIVGDMNAP